MSPEMALPGSGCDGSGFRQLALAELIALARPTQAQDPSSAASGAHPNRTLFELFMRSRVIFPSFILPGAHQ